MHQNLRERTADLNYEMRLLAIQAIQDIKAECHNTGQ
jgi:hypothetical protein